MNAKSSTLKSSIEDFIRRQGISAEMLAEKYKLTRECLDQYSLESHRRAAQATDEGRFAREILPLPIETEQGALDQRAVTIARDEGIRAGSTLEKLATLKTVFKADGVVTAANSSQLPDDARRAAIAHDSRRPRFRPCRSYSPAICCTWCVVT